MHNYRLSDGDRTAQIDDVIIKFSKNIDGTSEELRKSLDGIKKYFGLKEKNNE